MKWLILMLTCLKANAALQVRFTFEGDVTGTITDQSGRGHDGVQMNPTNRIFTTNGVGGSSGGYWLTNGSGSDGVNLYPLGCYLAITNVANITYLTQCTFSVWAQFENKRSTNVASAQNTYTSFMDCIWNSASTTPSASNSWWFGRFASDYVGLFVSDLSQNNRQVIRFPVDAVNVGAQDYSTTTFHQYLVTVDCIGNQVISYYDGAPYQTNTIGIPWLYAYGGVESSFPSGRWICVGSDSHGAGPIWGGNGANNYPNDGYFRGLLDEVRIYDNVLTPANVLYIYNNPTLDYPPTPTVSLSGAVQLNGSASFR